VRFQTPKREGREGDGDGGGRGSELVQWRAIGGVGRGEVEEERKIHVAHIKIFYYFTYLFPESLFGKIIHFSRPTNVFYRLKSC
jgi:hypothetical protein